MADKDTERLMEVKILGESRTFKIEPEPLKHPTHFNPFAPAVKVDTQPPTPPTGTQDKKDK